MTKHKAAGAYCMGKIAEEWAKAYENELEFDPLKLAVLHEEALHAEKRGGIEKIMMWTQLSERMATILFYSAQNAIPEH